MPQTGEECLQFLKEAKEALEGVEAVRTCESQWEQKVAQLEKSYDSEHRRMTDLVQQTIKTRRDEIRENFDKELSKLQDELKKARAKRERAKNQGIRERIEDETSGFESEVKNLKVQFSNLAKQRRLPMICRTKLYYSLYFPRHLKEFMTFLMFVLFFFLLLPVGIYFLLPKHRWLYLAGIYLVDLLIVGGIYISIGNHTKLLYMETLRELRTILDQIQDNTKQKRRKTKEIQRDRNEAQYNLDLYDDEITRLQKEIDDVGAQKKEALNTYENVTKTILTDEIENSFKEKLDKLSNDLENARMQQKVSRQELKDRHMYVSDHYMTYLGQEFMDPARVAKLCLIVQSGKASSVSEAIEVYRRSNS